MPTKTFTIKCANKHNAIKIKSDIEDITIVSVTIPDKDGTEYYVSGNSFELDSEVQYRYKTSASPVVYVTISHSLAESFVIGEDIIVDILMTRFVNYGQFISEKHTIAFGNTLNVHSVLTNEGDCGVLCIVHGNCIQSNGQSESFRAIIPLNENRLIVQKASETLFYPAKNAKLYYDGLLLEDNAYTINSNIVEATISLNDKFILYQRDLEVEQLSQNVFIDSNYTISINKKYDYIEYIIELVVTSLNISQIETTPIIQSIALVSTNDN